MNISITHDEQQTLFQLVGRLDTITAPELHDDLIIAFDTAKMIVLDFTEIEYISSAGLRVLLIGEKHARSKNAQMKLINVSDDVMEILEMTGFSDKLTIE